MWNRDSAWNDINAHMVHLKCDLSGEPQKMGFPPIFVWVQGALTGDPDTTSHLQHTACAIPGAFLGKSQVHKVHLILSQNSQDKHWDGTLPSSNHRENLWCWSNRSKIASEILYSKGN